MLPSYTVPTLFIVPTVATYGTQLLYFNVVTVAIDIFESITNYILQIYEGTMQNILIHMMMIMIAVRPSLVYCLFPIPMCSKNRGR